MKKVGILTFHGGINYGGTLQAYSLYAFLKKKGYDVEIIDFIYPKGKTTLKGRVGILYRTVLLMLEPIIHRSYYTEKSKSREVFRNFLSVNTTLSPKVSVSGLDSLSSRYDAIVTGSDQIWGHSGHYHGAYFLAPLKNYKGLRISYSPCCAQNKIEVSNRKFIGDALLKYDYISVRNTETQQFVESIIGVKPETVLDPTFLISFSAVFTATELKNIPNKYIFVYTLGQDIAEGSAHALEQIKQSKGDDLKVVVVASDNCSELTRKCADVLLTSVSPADWVYLIRNAAFVYTNSFHAMVFAIKFRVDFLAYYREKARASRFVYMAEKFDLSEHIVGSMNEAQENGLLNSIPDFDHIGELLEVERVKSIAFLDKALNKLGQ